GEVPSQEEVLQLLTEPVLEERGPGISVPANTGHERDKFCVVRRSRFSALSEGAEFTLGRSLCVGVVECRLEVGQEFVIGGITNVRDHAGADKIVGIATQKRDGEG